MIQNSMFPMFFMSDALRRSLGWLLDAAGLAPHEASWHIVLKIFSCGAMANKPRPPVLF